MKITVLGSGRWASNIIGLLLKKGHSVLAWEKVFDDSPESEFYLSGKNSYIDLSKYYDDKTLSFTHNLEDAVNHSQVVFISILAQKVDELMQEIKKIEGYSEHNYVLAMKGIESTTGRTLSEILMDNGVNKGKIAALAGPGHPQSIVAGKATRMVVAGYDSKFAEEVKQLLDNGTYRLSTKSDVKGTEICAAAKNVYGGLGGMCVGSGNETMRGSLMCASLSEMKRYLEAMQCVPKTAEGLALLGDYDATMYDTNSHNFIYGREVIVQGTTEPKLPFSSIEGKDAADGLIKRMINYNNQVSDKMQLEAPLIQTYSNIVNKKILLTSAFEEIINAIDRNVKLDHELE